MVGTFLLVFFLVGDDSKGAPKSHHDYAHFLRKGSSSSSSSGSSDDDHSKHSSFYHPYKEGGSCSKVPDKSKTPQWPHHDGRDNHEDGLGATHSLFGRHYFRPRSNASKPLPDPRYVSNHTCAQGSFRGVNAEGLNALATVFGQFLDHMLTQTEKVDGTQLKVGPGVLKDARGSLTLLDQDDIPQQQNALSSFIDASAVYGNSAQLASRLRTYKDGLMKTSYGPDGDLLPHAESGNAYLAGDSRNGAHSALTAMHCLWLREHNILARKFKHDTPGKTDEELYQTARQWVIAEIQAIVYKEYLPALLGKDALSRACYSPHTDPTIFNSWTTAAYRFGHSMVNEEWELRDARTGKLEGFWSLRQIFHERPEGGLLKQAGISRILLGMRWQGCEEIDVRVIDGLRNHLLQSPDIMGGKPSDLVSRNIARGRAHKIPDYATMRWKLHGTPVNGWEDISTDPEIVHRLKAGYGDHGYHQLDLWVGLLAEDHAHEASVGPTARILIGEQFARIRDSDRYFVLWNPWLNFDRDVLWSTSFKNILLDNTDINPKALPDGNIFLLPDLDLNK